MVLSRLAHALLITLSEPPTRPSAERLGREGFQGVATERAQGNPELVRLPLRGNVRSGCRTGAWVGGCCKSR